MIAIVGMAGRFPGAPDLETYWRNLVAGREGITRFTDDALRARGVADADLRDPAYVKANGVLDGVELFDASFFGFTPLEAEITDPQHRLFLETAWQALEDAGYHAHAFDGRIGVFAGAGASTYLIHHLLARPDVLARVGPVQLSIGNNKDYAPTRVSYKLDLKGPSVSVNTACSSSLVAVHLACQSLLDYHADLVIAGGVGIQVPQDVGYHFLTGGIASPDGRCRPFDAKAQGTVSGNGVGVVVLRRLADAIADGDDIRAVILGSAVNNDGAAKVGYTAPSVAGQAEVIAEAMAVAEVDPATIQYVEAHGTGTVVGDPIEVAALTQAFRMRTDRTGFCALGSVKSNIGHLDEAAGVAGLIKTVLALQHGEIPPSLHYDSPNPEIDFASSPFFVNASTRPWPKDGPRRAGVSSFGIGGTNAHVVLEAAPAREARADAAGPQLLVLSAKTATALQQRCRDLAAHLGTHPELNLADVAWTLQQGRRPFEHRAAVVVSTLTEAQATLLERAGGTGKASGAGELNALAARWERGEQVDWSGVHGGAPRRRVPLPTYPFERQRYWIDPARDSAPVVQGAAALQKRADVADWFYAPSWRRTAPPVPNSSVTGEWLLLADASGVSTELARALRDAGQRVTESRAGHPSVADRLQGALDDPIRVIDCSLLDDGPGGAPVDPIAHIFGLAREIARSSRRVDLSVITAGAADVIGDEPFRPDVAAAVAPLLVLGQERPDVRARWIDVSGWVRQEPDALTASLTAELLGGSDPEVGWRNGYRWTRAFEPAQLPAASPAAITCGGAYLLTGGLGGVGLILADHLATRYGARLALVSRSAGAIAAALDGPGPGAAAGPAHAYAAVVERAVSEAARELPVRGVDAYPDLEHTIDRLCGSYALALAAGAGLDTRAGATFDTRDLKRRLAVVQPLERLCDYLGSVLAEDGLVERDGARVVFSARAALTPGPEELHREAIARYPEFAGTFELLRHCVRAYPDALSGAVPAISVLYPGGEPVLLEQAAARTVAHSTRDVYVRAIRDLLVERASARPGRTLRVLEVGVGDGLLAGVVAPALAGLDVEYHATDIGRSFVTRAQAAAAQAGLSPMMRFATLDISRDPATQGFAPGSFDVVLALDVLHATPDLRDTLDHVHRLLAPGGAAAVIETVNPPRWVHFIWGLADGWWAFRDPLRRRQSPLLSLEEWAAAFRDRGFAHVASFPSGDAAHAGDYGLIVAEAEGVAGGTHAERTVRRLRAAGTSILLLEADVADPAAMAAAVAETQRTFGRLDGVIHAAGETRRELVINPIVETGETQRAAMLRPKVAGTESLAAALADVPVDFVLLLSSNASVLGGLGLSAYAAASRYLDAFAAARWREGDRRWISSNWDGWPTEAAAGLDSRFHTSIDRFAMSLDECRDAFERVLQSAMPQVVVSSADLAERRRRWVEAPRLDPSTRNGSLGAGSDAPPVADSSPSHARPDIGVAFAPARTAFERELARIWEELLGINPIGIDDEFADLGGDSLLGTELIARVEQSLGHRLPFSVLFDAPTVRQQATLIAAQAAPAPAPAVSAIPRVPEAATHALSHAQRRLWVLSQLEGSAAYNIPLHQRLDGPLDLPALERALSRLAERHEILRTRIVTVDAEPRQRIEAPASVALPILDLSARPDAEQAALTLARQDAAAPFDLERAPAWRASLLRLGHERHILLLTFHHIACDGVSIAVLGRDLAACYDAAVAGEEPRLPALPMQYRDFAAWQLAQLDDEGMAAHRRYWREALSGTLPVLELPLDAPRPATQTFVGHERGWHLAPDQAARIAGLARAQHVSLFMLLSAAVKVLLHRYTGQADIIVGSPVAGRTHPDLEHQVGFYLNMLPLRDRVRGSMRFVDLLQEVRATATAAYDHQAYPFDRLVHDLNLARDLSRSPVFDVIVMLQNQQESELALRGLATAPVFDHNGTSKADLTFNFKESPRGLAIGIEYNTGLFAAERIERLGGQLLTLLDTVVHDPQQAIGDVDLLSADERRAIAAVNDTAAAYPADATVLDLIRATAADAPARIGCRCGDQQLTRAELLDRAARVASWLAARGVVRGDRVGIHLERSIDLLPAVLGVFGAGAAYVPLDPAFPADRLRLMADDAALKLVLTEALVAEAATGPAAGVPGRPGPRDLAYAIYTSGSTGRPKGVAVEHASLVNFLCSMQRRPGLSASDTLVAVTTLSFDIAGLELFLPLVAGATVVIATREQVADGRLLQELLRESRATVMQATPATWQLLIESGWQGDATLTVLCGGEALPLELARWLAARCRRVWNLYGPTETTIWSSVLDLTAALASAEAGHPVPGSAGSGVMPIGAPIANTSIYVLDARLQPQPAGVPGELYIGGAGLARGYLGLPDLTADRFLPDPFAVRPGARMYRTGDRVVRGAGGTFEFLGRLDDQIKLRGHRIEIGDIENALLAHGLVARAAVVLDQAPAGPRLLAGVVTQPGRTGSDDEVIGELRQHLRAALPEYMVPSAFVFLDDLPRTPNGKVDRRALRARAAAATAAHVPTAPATPLERRIAGVWAEALGLQAVGADTDFFASGGHSLTAARLAFRLGEELGIEFTLMDVFQHPTVAAQAALAAARPANERAHGATPHGGPIPIAPLTADELDMLNE